MRETLKFDLMRLWFFLLHEGLAPNGIGVLRVVHLSEVSWENLLYS